MFLTRRETVLWFDVTFKFKDILEKRRTCNLTPCADNWFADHNE